MASRVETITITLPFTSSGEGCSINVLYPGYTLKIVATYTGEISVYYAYMDPDDTRWDLAIGGQTVAHSESKSVLTSKWAQSWLN